MSTSAFPMMNRTKPINIGVADATLRDFSGGLKSVESDTTLKSSDSVVLTNMFVHEGYSQVLRFGTKEFATTADDIIGIHYGGTKFIAALADGTIQTIDDAGTVVTIWDSTIAATLPGSPSGWVGTATRVTFTEENGTYIIQNGVDKPVIVSNTYVVTYLQDLATLTNINTPIALFGTMVDDYFVVALDTTDPTIIVSSKGASGTFIGDALPNDSVSKNLGRYISTGNGKIKGLHSFRNNLFVFLESAIIVLRLGIYDDSGNHVPEVVDTIFGLGLINHDAAVALEKDFVFLSNDGVFSSVRSILSGNFESKPLSEDILPLIYQNVFMLLNEGDKTFLVQDKIKKKLFFFIRKADTTSFVFVMSYTSDMKKISWSIIEGWDFDGGCYTKQKRVFFYKGDTIYQYGNDVFADEDYYADLISAGNPTGTAINFDWELPWLDIGTRSRTKELKRLNAETLGTANFTLQIFADRNYKDSLGAYIPDLSMNMRAGSVTGYGTPSIGYGGGRRISDERLYGFPIRFKIFKMRITGSTKEKLSINSITIFYKQGRFHR